MIELEGRLIATQIIGRLKAHGHEPIEISVRPNGSGVTTRVGFLNHLLVECHIPPGFFNYDLVADAMCQQIQKAVMESD